MACEPEAIPITGDLTPEAEAVVREALHDASAWSPVEVCVAEVQLDAQLSEDHAVQGQARSGPRPRVRLDPDLSDRALRAATLHELCHVLDRDHGLSSQRPDLFDGDGLPTQYTGDAAIREDFARACELGPVDPVHRHVASSCGVDDDPRAWVDQQVWSAAPAAFDIAPSAPPEVTVHWRLHTDGEAVPAWLQGEVIVAWPDLVDLDGEIGHVVRMEGYDPDTGEALGTWHTPWAPTLEGNRFAWVRGDGRLLLQSVPGGESWTLDPDRPGTLTPTGLPAARWIGGALDDGWVALQADAPDSGVWELHPDGTSTTTPSALAPDTLVGGVGWLGGEVVAFVAEHDGTWSLRRAADGEVVAGLPAALESVDLLDGHALATWATTTDAGPLEATVWVEADDPTVHVATGCDDPPWTTPPSPSVQRADATYDGTSTEVRVETWAFPTGSP